MAKAKEKTQKQIKQEEAFKKLAEFTKKTAKELDVTITSDLSTNREGRNGAIPSSSLCFDLITGGGFPTHRWTILSGASGSGKTTLMQSAIASQLQSGGMSHYADFEGACDGSWIKNATGIDLAAFEGGKNSTQTFFPLFDFASGDDYFRYMNRLLDQTVELGVSDMEGLTHLFCLDSIPAMAPEDLVDDDESGSKPYIALILAKWMPVIKSRLKRANSAMIAINQIRSKVRLKNPFEDPLYEPGGHTPAFLADLRVYIEQVQPKHVDGEKHELLSDKIASPKQGGLWSETDPEGLTDQYVYRKIRTVKNRVFSPYRQSYIRICTSRASKGGEGTGIDPVFDVINFYEEIGKLKFMGVKDIQLEGKSYSYWDLKNEILTNPDLRNKAAELLDNGQAFDLYSARLTGMGEGIGKPNSEDE